MKLINDILHIVEETSSYLNTERLKLSADDIEVKSMNSLVTYVDKHAEELLVSGLGALLPDASFYTEEETVVRNQDKEYTWIIDPLDGTTNYLHGIPFYSISVALQQNDEIICGVVKECVHDETYYAMKGEGAYMNGKKISVSLTSDISQAILATGFPYENFDRVKEYLEALVHLMKNTRGVRRFGSAALDLAYVACGRFDAFYEYGLNAWDVAAGYLLVKEAGGAVSTFSGTGSPIWDQEIMASNNLISSEICNLLSSYFDRK